MINRSDHQTLKKPQKASKGGWRLSSHYWLRCRIGFSNQAENTQELSADLLSFLSQEDTHIFQVFNCHWWAWKNRIISNFLNRSNHNIPNHQKCPYSPRHPTERRKHIWKRVTRSLDKAPHPRPTKRLVPIKNNELTCNEEMRGRLKSRWTEKTRCISELLMRFLQFNKLSLVKILSWMSCQHNFRGSYSK